MLYAVKSFGKINKARERSCWNVSLVLLTSLSFHDNKLQLIDIIIICASLQDDWVLRNRQKHKQAFTVKMRFLLKWFQAVMSCQGKVCPQHSYDEAGNIKVQQAIWIDANEKMYVRVLVDDTDVYVLLLHHYLHDGLIKRQWPWRRPFTNRTVIDVPANVDKLGDIIPSMLAGHALTGCDTLGAYFGIG